MKINTIFIACLLQTASLSCTALKNGADEDAYIAGDHQLYEETQHYIDPNDMLADLSARRQAFKKKSSQHPDSLKDEGSHLDPLECKSIRAKLNGCNARQEVLELELQSKEATNVKILQQLATQGTVDYELHYRRFLSLLLQAVRSESDVQETDGSLRRPLTFVLAEDVLTGLDRCVAERAPSGEHVRRCDELLTVLFHAVELRDEGSSITSFFWPQEWQSSPIFYLEVLLPLVGLMLLLLAVWAAVLLVHDVWRSRRWAPFLLLLLALIITFCCLWNWRIMIKEVEARRAGELELQGLGGSPEECRTEGFWAWITGARSKCTKYYTDVFIKASEEVTLEQVMVRTLTTLLLSPLRALGRECGLFFNEFYSSISVFYVLPASVMLLCIMTLLLYFCCRESGRTYNYQHSDASLDGLAYQLRRENQQMLLESRTMMESIGVALHTSAQRAQIVQPLLDSSCRHIERQLDSLIAARFEALTQQNAPRDPAPVQQCINSVAQAPREQIACLSAADLTDGSRLAVTEGSNASVSASESGFAEKVMSVVNKSFSESYVTEDSSEKHEEGNPPNMTVRKRASCQTSPLSPAGEKFLGEVRKAMES